MSRATPETSGRTGDKLTEASFQYARDKKQQHSSGCRRSSLSSMKSQIVQTGKTAGKDDFFGDNQTGGGTQQYCQNLRHAMYGQPAQERNTQLKLRVQSKEGAESQSVIQQQDQIVG